MHVSLDASLVEHKDPAHFAIDRAPFPSWRDILQGVAHLINLLQFYGRLSYMLHHAA